MSSSNAVVFAQYTLTALEVPITPFNQTAVALFVVLMTVGIVGISTKWSLRIINFLTVVKVTSLAFMVVTGVAVLLGLTPIKDPYANFHNLFEGTSTNPNALATALVKVNHAFIGWHNAYNVLGEVKGPNPVGTVRKSSLIALTLMTALFMLVIVSYVAVVPLEDLRNSGQLIAALFFQRLFGPVIGVKVLPLLVSCSCFGNIIAVAIGQTRVIREVARQGLLPFPSFFSSTRPFGTPLGPVILKIGLTYLVILAVPAKDAFNFVLDLASYPHLVLLTLLKPVILTLNNIPQVFQIAMCFGVWVLRKRRGLAGLRRSLFESRNSTVVLYLFSCILLLLLPWVPPEPGHADVSFWYATYCVAGLAIIASCGVYYCIWIVLLPKLGGYEIVEEVETLPDGARNAKLVRRYKRVEDPRQPLLSSLN
ncbi:hypothetical protein H0H93_000985 [Arthromyces matolae]|nr:hypothetical protein H0H93_000985 [Arthromyces matolae]